MRRLLRTFVASALVLATVAIGAGSAHAATSQGCALYTKQLDGTYTYDASDCTFTADPVSGPPTGYTTTVSGTGWMPLATTIDIFQCSADACSDSLASIARGADGSFGPAPVTVSRTITYTDAGGVQTADCPPDECELYAVAVDPSETFQQMTVVQITFDAPVVSVSPPELAFGDQVIGTTSAPLTSTLTNTGTAAWHPTGLGSNADPEEFTILSETCSFAEVAPGGSCSITVTFTPKDLGERTAFFGWNDDTVEGAHSVFVSGNGIEPQDRSSDLAVALSATPNPVKAGSTVTYTVSTRNNGPDDASNVKLDDVLPTAAQFSTIKADGWSCTTPPKGSTGTISCTRSTMASGTSSVITITATVVSSGKSTITDTASISSATGDPNPANNSASVTTSVSGRR